MDGYAVNRDLVVCKNTVVGDWRRGHLFSASDDPAWRTQFARFAYWIARQRQLQHIVWLARVSDVYAAVL